MHYEREAQAVFEMNTIHELKQFFLLFSSVVLVLFTLFISDKHVIFDLLTAATVCFVGAVIISDRK